jgi:hypothetical protein
LVEFSGAGVGRVKVECGVEVPRQKIARRRARRALLHWVRRRSRAKLLARSETKVTVGLPIHGDAPDACRAHADRCRPPNARCDVRGARRADYQKLHSASGAHLSLCSGDHAPRRVRSLRLRCDRWRCQALFRFWRHLIFADGCLYISRKKRRRRLPSSLHSPTALSQESRPTERSAVSSWGRHVGSDTRDGRDVASHRLITSSQERSRETSVTVAGREGEIKSWLYRERKSPPIPTPTKPTPRVTVCPSFSLSFISSASVSVPFGLSLFSSEFSFQPSPLPPSFLSKDASPRRLASPRPPPALTWPLGLPPRNWWRRTLLASTMKSLPSCPTWSRRLAG